MSLKGHIISSQTTMYPHLLLQMKGVKHNLLSKISFAGRPDPISEAWLPRRHSRDGDEHIIIRRMFTTYPIGCHRQKVLLNFAECHVSCHKSPLPILNLKWKITVATSMVRHFTPPSLATRRACWEHKVSSACTVASLANFTCSIVEINVSYERSSL